jgi:uncharacterized membrane protein YphA (DoxX/SURF4 family)
MSFSDFDTAFIRFANKWFDPLARLALFIIFFYFGILKVLELSPADQLAKALVEGTVGLTYFDQLFFILALYECLIGVLFLIPKYTRLAIFLLLLHLPLVTSPLLLVPHEVWRAPLVPNLEGQYIIKNIALVVLAVGLASRTTPLIRKKK